MNREKIVEMIKARYPEYSQVFFRDRGNTPILFVLKNDKFNASSLKCFNYYNITIYIDIEFGYNEFKITLTDIFQRESLERNAVNVITMSLTNNNGSVSLNIDDEAIIAKLKELRQSFCDYRHYEGIARRRGIYDKNMFKDE